MIGDYLNQVVSWKNYTGVTSQQGDKIYDSAVSIKARKRRVQQSELSTHGETIDAQFIIHTTVEVEVGDLLDDMVVLRVSELVNYAGVVIGVVAYT